MSRPLGSKEAAADLIDPFSAPEPSQETGPGASLGSTMPSAHRSNASPSTTTGSKNPYRKDSLNKSSTANKNGVNTSVRSSSGGSTERFPKYRAEAFGDGTEPTSRRRAGSHGTPPSYVEATSTINPPGRRRGSSLRERYPGDKSHQPLDIIRRDSRKAGRSPHLNKRSMPGADAIDRLDPAIGGRAYHHEGPYDAASMARNHDPKTGPLGALETTNKEALKATPRENIRNAVERHQPLDGVAFVPPGVPDQFGRTYEYEEGADLMREASSADAGYKRWPGKEYDPEDLKGQSEPAFSLDRALKAHKIDDNGIEMEDRAHLMKDYHDQEREGELDSRDPVEIAGDDGKYVDTEVANADAHDNDARLVRGGSLKTGLKNKIGSLRHRKAHDE